MGANASSVAQILRNNSRPTLILSALSLTCRRRCDSLTRATMKHTHASQTALMTAAYRARASRWDKPLFNDPWAAALGGRDGEALAVEYLRGFPPMELWCALRTAYMDAHIAHWTAAPHGFSQVVLLGAGLDTRAARLRSDGVAFYEVDHPDTQREKLRRLRALPDYPIDAATYVGCNFEDHDFLVQLADAGFDTASPAVIIWEGVTAYLSESAVRSTLRRVASGCDRHSVIIFDYLSRQMAQGTNITDADRQTRAVVSSVGEEFRFGSNNVLPLLYAEGFQYVRVINFDEVCLSMHGSYDRERLFRFQHMAVASVTTHSQL